MNHAVLGAANLWAAEYVAYLMFAGEIVADGPGVNGEESWEQIVNGCHDTGIRLLERSKEVA